VPFPLDEVKPEVLARVIFPLVTVITMVRLAVSESATDTPVMLSAVSSAVVRVPTESVTVGAAAWAGTIPASIPTASAVNIHFSNAPQPDPALIPVIVVASNCPWLRHVPPTVHDRTEAPKNQSGPGWVPRENSPWISLPNIITAI
jgi:hypothetical protein